MNNDILLKEKTKKKIKLKPVNQNIDEFELNWSRNASFGPFAIMGSSNPEWNECKKKKQIEQISNEQTLSTKPEKSRILLFANDVIHLK